jgi:D-glycero-D-manno-heptose 1,7-bisphosphate phosphatase
VQPSLSAASGPRGLFLDRDGTLIKHIPYLHDPDGVVLIPGVKEALCRARDAGFRLYLFTNQSGVGRGMFSLESVDAVNRRMEALLGFSGPLFAGVCIAPEAPDQPSRYRKPSPRFIEEVCARDGLAKEQSWMVGDSPSDWEAGWRAGVRIGSVGGSVNEDPAWSSFRQRWGVVSAPSLAELIVPILASSGP